MKWPELWRSNPTRRGELVVGPLMILPAIVGLGAVPVPAADRRALNSFRAFNPFTKRPNGWVGFANFAAVLGDRAFQSAMLVTLIYIVLILVVIIPLALALALLLDRRTARHRLRPRGDPRRPCRLRGGERADLEPDVRAEQRPLQRAFCTRWAADRSPSSSRARHAIVSHRGDDRLEGRRPADADLPRRAAGDPAAPLRGGGHRRRLGLEHLPAHHAAPAPARA